MNETKQVSFINRILFLHSLANRRAGKASAVRLSPQEWAVECDRACLLAHILNYTQAAVDPKGDQLFKDDALQAIFDRSVEGLPAFNSK